MKEDYLWDKTGEDADVQALENALKAFRFQENAPPPMPQKVFTVERQGWRKVFRLSLAFASLASVALVFSLAWFGLSGGVRPASEIAAKADELKRVEKSAADAFVAPRDETAPVQSPEIAPPTAVKAQVVKVSRKRAPLVRPLKAVWRKPPPKAPAETLTAEEKYAYQQLMLALSITGAQLKIVKDKVQGIEEQNAVVETEK